MTKRTKEEIDAWLNDLYLECIQKGIPHEQREWIVRSKINDFIKVWSRDPIPEEEYAIQWMRNRCKPDCNTLLLPIVAFYFDTKFWKVEIPRIYGFQNFNSFDSLIDMPNILKNIIDKDESFYAKYESLWADAIDLSQGRSDIRILSDHPLHNNLIAKNFLFSGIENLNTATSALLHPTQTSQTIMNIRIALEMFIKSYIAYHDSTAKTHDEKDRQARKLSHDLEKGLEKIQQLAPKKLSENFFEIIKLFPNINDRYIPQTMNIVDIASCYTLTVHLGAMVTRSITDRNILNQ